MYKRNIQITHWQKWLKGTDGNNVRKMNRFNPKARNINDSLNKAVFSNKILIRKYTGMISRWKTQKQEPQNIPSYPFFHFLHYFCSSVLRRSGLPCYRSKLFWEILLTFKLQAAVQFTYCSISIWMVGEKKTGHFCPLIPHNTREKSKGGRKSIATYPLTNISKHCVTKPVWRNGVWIFCWHL